MLTSFYTLKIIKQLCCRRLLLNMALVLTRSTKESLKKIIQDHNQDLESIREWLESQPHLPQNLDDRFLLNFLRGCKYSLETFKSKLDMYFTVRAAVPEIFTNRDVSTSALQELLSYAYVVTLPTLTPAGNTVHLAGTTTTDFKTPDIADFFKIVTMMRDLRLYNEEVTDTGDIYILDASAAISKHFLKLSPVTLKKSLICFTKVYSASIKEVHVVNFSPFVNTIVNFVRPLLKEKIMKRIHFHQDLDSLHKHVPKDMLPEEFGGTAGKLDGYREKTVEYLAKHTDWFKQQENVVADESKRPQKLNCCEDFFGLNGSFRQLNID